MKNLRSLAGLMVLGVFLGNVAVADEQALKNESEAGVVIVSGNSESESYSAKHTSTYTWVENLLRFNARYLRTTSFSVESAKQWALGLRYERKLSEKFSVFIGQNVESNFYSGVLQKYNTDLGGKYFFFNREKDLIWLGEGGYRYTVENKTRTISQNFHYARVFTEFVKYFSDGVYGKLWIEYLPNFTVSDDWQMNGEASVSAMISQVFSLKTSYLLNYDNLPNTGKTTDTTFTTALVATF